MKKYELSIILMWGTSMGYIFFNTYMENEKKMKERMKKK